MIHIIYSSEEGKYLLLDSDNNVLEKVITHEEALLRADILETGWVWDDECAFALR